MALGESEVHVWRTSLCSGWELAWEILSAEEKARAEQFHFERDKRRFVLCRAALRGQIARYTGVAPQDAALEYGPFGKPRLPASCRLEFNVSHSGDAALLAFARHAVGVDIEAIRPVRHALSVAESFFAPSEIADLRLVEPAELDAAFLRCWTRKEARAKGLGEGLSGPDRNRELGNWRFHDLDAGPGFMAALAVDCADAAVIQRSL